MRKEQLARVEGRGRERGTPVAQVRPIAKLMCKSDPAVSRTAEPVSGVDSYVRHNTGLGHNPNLR